MTIKLWFSSHEEAIRLANAPRNLSGQLVHRAEDGKWYFWLEDLEERRGPYSFKRDAERALFMYGEEL